jgi:gas vesicle protein
MLQIEAQGVDLMKNTQLMQSEGVDEVGYAGEKQVHTKDADVFSEEMQGKVDALSNDVQSKVDDVQRKVDALSNDLQSKVDALSNDLQSKVDALSNDMQSMNGKVNDELKDLKVMMTKMMDMMARE